jgi:hypothetical protein
MEPTNIARQACYPREIRDIEKLAYYRFFMIGEGGIQILLCC